MAYEPKSWKFTTNESGDKVYEDHILNVVQENLKTLYQLIDDVNTDAKINILFVQNNVNTKTVKDSTAQTAGMFLSKIIEGLGVVFTAGTPAAIIATISCKIISGIITKVCEPSSEDTYNKIQSKANDLKDMADEICEQVQLVITSCLEDMKGQWNVEYDCQGLKFTELKGKVRLSDLAGTKENPFTDFLPKKPSTDYVHARKTLSTDTTYESAKALLPVKWKIKSQRRGFPSDGIGDPLGGWNVEYYKVYSRNTWDNWKSRSTFPKIDDNLRSDVEGPHEEIEKGNYSDKQRFLGFNGVCYDYPWSDGQRYEDGKHMGGSRWMGWSGKNDKVLSKSDDILKGTSFLDLIDDILNGHYFGSGQWSVEDGLPKHPSYLLWYRTKRKNEDVIIINDKREWTLIGNDACIDWEYDSNSWFTWGRAYRGLKLHHYYLVDENEGHASQEFCDWLFRDNGHGKITSEKGIAGRIDVYHNWGLSFV